jgi:hypothetical protein
MKKKNFQAKILFGINTDTVDTWQVSVVAFTTYPFWQISIVNVNGTAEVVGFVTVVGKKRKKN